MTVTIESCPHLCARQGVTARHEVGPAEVLRRLIAIAWVLVTGIAGLALRRGIDAVLHTGRAPRYVARLHRRALRACAVEIDIVGARPTLADRREGVLVVANHVSWLDVMGLAMVSRTPLRMVSKREIGDWPVIGMLARSARTIFIDRYAVRSVEATRRAAAEALRSGQVIATFPEATTTCGRGLGRLYPAMFQAAIDAEVPVQPVALSFHDRHGQVTTAAAYVGTGPLWESIRTIVGQRDLRLRIEILPRILPKHVRPIEDRKALRTAAAQSIGSALDAQIGPWSSHHRPSTCHARRVPGVLEQVLPIHALSPVALWQGNVGDLSGDSVGV